MNALFSIGQKVVCVDSSERTHYNPPPLIEGKTYTVKGVRQCSCGMVSVDVGFTTFSDSMLCAGCLIDRPTGGNHWCKQTRFVPLDFDRQADEEIHEALKGIKIYNP